MHRVLTMWRRDSPEWAVLDALPALVAILDRQGRIVATNSAWERAARARSGAHIGVGADYVAACRNADGDAYAAAALDGLQAMLEGRLGSIEVAYPCPAYENDDAWFLLQARPVTIEGEPLLVVVHSDISAFRRGLTLQTARDERARQSEAREVERLAIGRLGGPGHTPVTQRAFGLAPLATAEPRIAEELRAMYREAFRRALESRVYRVATGEREVLRALAERLVFLQAAARDVVDLHQHVLVELVSGATDEDARASYEEGRVLLVALMGEVMTGYRARAAAGAWLAPDQGSGAEPR